MHAYEIREKPSYGEEDSSVLTMAAMADLFVDDEGEAGHAGAGNGRGRQSDSEELQLVLPRGLEGRWRRLAVRQPWAVMAAICRSWSERR